MLDGKTGEWLVFFRGELFIAGIYDNDLEWGMAAPVEAVQQDQQGCFSITGGNDGADLHLMRIERCHGGLIYFPLWGILS